MRMEWFMAKAIMMHGQKNEKKNLMHEYTICNGKFVGNFEGLYKSFKDPFAQTKLKNLKHQKKQL